MRVLITGASGLVGKRLSARLLDAGHAVIGTSRDPASTDLAPGVHGLRWDGVAPFPPPGPVDGVVHLLGDSIAKGRWTEAKRQRLLDSRLVSTRRLVEWMAGLPTPRRPRVFVCANAVGYYGLRPAGRVDESAAPGDDFLARLCRAWEAEARKAPVRTVVLRIGHVLSADGGYLGSILPFSRLGLGGPLGSGRQPFPWIHIDDLCAILQWALVEANAAGVYNAVAPAHDVQCDLVRALDRVLPVRSRIPIPAAALRLRFGEFADAMLGGQEAEATRLLGEGYAFLHADLGEAVADLVPRPRARKRGARA
jgi:uncharacterized protein